MKLRDRKREGVSEQIVALLAEGEKNKSASEKYARFFYASRNIKTLMNKKERIVN